MSYSISTIQELIQVTEVLALAKQHELLTREHAGNILKKILKDLGLDNPREPKKEKTVESAEDSK